jgi:glycogen phosphorylase
MSYSPLVSPKALRSFTVRARLPEALVPLQEIAMNLRWSWDNRARDLFRWVDPDAWQKSGGDPLKVLGTVSRQRFETLAGDTSSPSAGSRTATARYARLPTSRRSSG